MMARNSPFAGWTPELIEQANSAYQAEQEATDRIRHEAYAEGRQDEREEQETFLRDLLWGKVQRCCGDYESGDGGEYMGQREVVPVCCGCPDVERNDDAHILAVLRARIPDPEREDFDNGPNSDAGPA